MDKSKLVNLDLLVKDNIRILTLPAKKFARPVGIILVGPPFSGKTTLVEHLKAELPLVLLSETNIGSFLAPRATFFKRGDEEILILASKTIEELIRMRYSCVYDASVKKHTDRQMLRKLIEDAGGKMALIHLVLSEDELYTRLQKVNAQIVRGDRRGFIMNKDLFRYELNSIERPWTEEKAIIYRVLIDTPEKLVDQLRHLFSY